MSWFRRVVALVNWCCCCCRVCARLLLSSCCVAVKRQNVTETEPEPTSTLTRTSREVSSSSRSQRRCWRRRRQRQRCCCCCCFRLSRKVLVLGLNKYVGTTTTATIREQSWGLITKQMPCRRRPAWKVYMGIWHKGAHRYMLYMLYVCRAHFPNLV